MCEAKSMAEDARSRACKAAAGVKASLEERIGAAREAAAKAAEPITSCVGKVVQAVDLTRTAGLEYMGKARAAVFDYASAARQAAASTHEEIKLKGARAWAVETTKLAQQVVSEAAAAAKVRASLSISEARTRAIAEKEVACQRAKEATERAAEKAKELRVATSELVSQKSFQTTAASAATGAVALGAGGGATGLAAGGALGAAAGVPLALFTFGLSIPIGAAVGGGAGLVMGAASGATAGLVGGGAAGYGVYQKRDNIREVATVALGKASEGAELVKGSASSSVGYVRHAAAAAKARLVGAGTGSTAETY